MEEMKERMPFNVGDTVEFLMTNGHTFRGVVDCICAQWVRLENGVELRLPYVIQLFVRLKADVGKEAEEFLAKEKCPEELKRNDRRKNEPRR